MEKLGFIYYKPLNLSMLSSTVLGSAQGLAQDRGEEPAAAVEGTGVAQPWTELPDLSSGSPCSQIPSAAWQSWSLQLPVCA